LGKLLTPVWLHHRVV